MTTLAFIRAQAGKGMGGRLRWLTIAGAAVAAVSATGVAVRVLVRRSRPSPGPAQPPIPAADLPLLTATATQIAVAYGDREPAAVSAVATTRGQALAVTVPPSSMSQQDLTPVYLVVMRGRFTGLSWQPGTRVPQGTHLFAVLDRASLGVLDLSIGGRSPSVPLDSLGAVAHLEPAHA